MQPIRIGIIGCGVIAPTHAACYRQHPAQAQLTWACDLDPARAGALAEKFEIPQTTTDYRQLLAAADVDLVSICTDHASHAPIACAALDAGKHVLCEKALAHQTEGLDAMLQAAERHPGQVFAGVFQHRHEPVNQMLRDIIQSGALGTMLTAAMQIRCWRSPAYYRGDAWRGTWAQEGGAVLINQAIHYVDLLQWLMGGVRTVSGTYANRAHQDCMETEDAVTAALTFASGAVGTLEATCASHLGWEPSLHFHCTEGSCDCVQPCEGCASSSHDCAQLFFARACTRFLSRSLLRGRVTNRRTAASPCARTGFHRRRRRESARSRAHSTFALSNGRFMR